MEACVRLSGDVGGSDWGQLQRRDPGATFGLRQDEEPNNQAMEAPDWYPDPGELLGRAAELCLQPCSGRLCYLDHPPPPDPQLFSLLILPEQPLR